MSPARFNKHSVSIHPPLSILNNPYPAHRSLLITSLEQTNTAYGHRITSASPHIRLSLVAPIHIARPRSTSSYQSPGSIDAFCVIPMLPVMKIFAIPEPVQIFSRKSLERPPHHLRGEASSSIWLQTSKQSPPERKISHSSISQMSTGPLSCKSMKNLSPTTGQS